MFSLFTLGLISCARQEAPLIVVVSDDRNMNTSVWRPVLTCKDLASVETVCKSGKLQILTQDENVIVVSPAEFAGLDNMKRAADAMKGMTDAAKSGEPVSLASLPDATRDAVRGVMSKSMHGAVDTSDDPAVALTSRMTFTLELDGKKVDVSMSDSRSPKYRAALKAITDRPVDPSKVKPLSTMNSGTSLPSSGVFQITFGVNCPSDPAFQAELANEIAKRVAAELKSREDEQAQMVAQAFKNSFDSDVKSLNGEIPYRGDKDSLPDATKNQLRENLVESWRSMGFSSKTEAERYWQGARLTKTSASVCMSFGLKSDGSPSVMDVILGTSK